MSHDYGCILETIGEKIVAVCSTLVVHSQSVSLTAGVVCVIN